MEDTKSDNKAQWDHTTCKWEGLYVIHAEDMEMIIEYLF